MKKKRAAMFVILLICLSGTVVFLILSPDRVPVHYNAAGQADRIGSRFEFLIFPLLNALAAGFFLLMEKHASRHWTGANAKIYAYTALLVLVFFTALGFLFMWKALRYDPAASRADISDVSRFVSAGLGILIILLGNMMPKVRRNSAVGLRTKWSMANDRVWQKSQRFGGIVMVIAGFLVVILALLVPELWAVVITAGVIASAAAVSALASRRFYLADREEHPS